MRLSFWDWVDSVSAPVQEPPRLKISDRYPNVRLRTQFNEPVRFRDAFIEDGRALIINPMYTTCNGSCPGTSATLENLRTALSPIFGKRLTILSFTLEPKVDTPKQLLSYAKIYNANRPRPKLCDWFFLTGAETEIDALRRSLGFYDLDPKIDNDPSQHASLILFGNSTTDRWVAMPTDLREPHLVETICRVAGFTFEQRYGIRS